MLNQLHKDSEIQKICVFQNVYNKKTFWTGHENE